MRRLLLCVLIVLSIGAGPAGADVTTGLIGWWTFDNHVFDVSGNGNHGVAVGGLVSTTNRFGAPNRAYLFNGTDSYVFVSNSASLSSPDTALTQAAWVSMHGMSLIGDALAPITMKSNSSANAFQYRMLADFSAFSVALNNWYTYGVAFHEFRPDQWYHLASVFDGSSVRFYVNGARVDSVGLATTILPDAHDFTIGADFPGVAEIFNGKIDEVRLYSRALTDEDIAELCNCPGTGVGDTPSAARSVIRATYPNPTSASTTVEIFLESASDVNISVYDVSGRLVRTLRSSWLPAGDHTERWDGRDASGTMMPSGVYFVRINAGGVTESTRTLLIR